MGSGMYKCRGQNRDSENSKYGRIPIVSRAYAYHFYSVTEKFEIHACLFLKHSVVANSKLHNFSAMLEKRQNSLANSTTS